MMDKDKFNLEVDKEVKRLLMNDRKPIILIAMDSFRIVAVPHDIKLWNVYTEKKNKNSLGEEYWGSSQFVASVDNFGNISLVSNFAAMIATQCIEGSLEKLQIKFDEKIVR